jgi:diphthamide synthase subunit DPH2
MKKINEKKKSGLICQTRLTHQTRDQTKKFIKKIKKIKKNNLAFHLIFSI